MLYSFAENKKIKLANSKLSRKRLQDFVIFQSEKKKLKL